MPNPVGRPPFKVTEENTLLAEELAAHGLTLEQIALNLGICYDTLNERRKEFPDFAEAIKRGKAKGIATISNKLFEKAKEGDNTAMIFYLKNRDPNNWEDVQKRQHGIDPKSKSMVSVTFTPVGNKD